MSPIKARKRMLTILKIPNEPTLYLPLLEFLNDDKQHSMKEFVVYLTKYFKLSKEAREELKLSGKETVFHNRVHWSKYTLKSKGYVKGIKKGTITITKKGKELLATNPTELNLRYTKKII